MKRDPKFKNWLKTNYSCAEYNKEFFLFQKQKTDEKDEIKFIFYWHVKIWDPPDSVNALLDTGIEKVCFEISLEYTTDFKTLLGSPELLLNE